MRLSQLAYYSHKFPTDNHIKQAIFDCYTFFSPAIPSLRTIKEFFFICNLRTPTGGNWGHSTGQIQRYVKRFGFLNNPKGLYGANSYRHQKIKLSQLSH